MYDKNNLFLLKERLKMVYHYRTVTCPYCGNIADRTRTVDSQELKGSPFRVCPHCDKAYFDPAYHEVAISVYKDEGGEVNFWGFSWFLISNGLVIFFIINAITEGKMLWAPFLIFLLIALVIDFGVGRLIYNKIHADIYHQKSIDAIEGRTKNQTGELAASMVRMSNKAYLDALKAHGVYVPDYFYERLRNGHVQTKIDMPESVETINSNKVEHKDEESVEALEEPAEYKATNEIIFCRKCGGKMPLDSSFCPKCGEKVISFHI